MKFDFAHKIVDRENFTATYPNFEIKGNFYPCGFVLEFKVQCLGHNLESSKAISYKIIDKSPDKLGFSNALIGMCLDLICHDTYEQEVELWGSL